MTLLDHPPISVRDDSTGTVLLENASWELYEILVRDRDAGKQHFKVTYDRGRMSIVSPSATHEKVKKFLGRMVEVLDLERDLRISSFGSTTWRREDLLIGLESDECYYIDRTHHFEGSKPVDLTREPAPDLAIEVDITSHPINRLSLYAGLGVGEVWRYDGKKVEIYVLTTAGTYSGKLISRLLPLITAEILNQFVAKLLTAGEAVAIRAFRDFLRTLPPVSSSPE